MKLFREELEKPSISRFRAKQLLFELANGELDNERKAQVEYWIKNCKETQVEWEYLNKALNWCETKSQFDESELGNEMKAEKHSGKISKKLALTVLAITLIALMLGGLYHYVDLSDSRYLLLSEKQNKILPRVEALEIEVASTDHAKIESILNQYKKEGTEIKSIPSNQNNEITWIAFVLQSHVRQLIEQIKTLGLVRIPEGTFAELVSDGQIQIILKSKSP